MEKKVMELIKKYAVCDDGLMESDDLAAIGIDSLIIVELIIDLEDAFQISFNDADLDPNRIEKVSDLLNLISKYV